MKLRTFISIQKTLLHTNGPPNNENTPAAEATKILNLAYLEGAGWEWGWVGGGKEM